jgi:predicted site-specific integrase-resolvase
MAEKLKVVTIKKACDMLGCARNTFHVKYSGKVDVYKAENGRSTLIPYEQIQEIIEEQRKAKSNILTRDQIELIE